jgi:hypothetical protein
MILGVFCNQNLMPGSDLGSVELILVGITGPFYKESHGTNLDFYAQKYQAKTCLDHAKSRQLPLIYPHSKSARKISKRTANQERQTHNIQETGSDIGEAKINCR